MDTHVPSSPLVTHQERPLPVPQRRGTQENERVFFDNPNVDAAPQLPAQDKNYPAELSSGRRTQPYSQHRFSVTLNQVRAQASRIFSRPVPKVPSLDAIPKTPSETVAERQAKTRAAIGATLVMSVLGGTIYLMTKQTPAHDEMISRKPSAPVMSYGPGWEDVQTNVRNEPSFFDHVEKGVVALNGAVRVMEDVRDKVVTLREELDPKSAAASVPEVSTPVNLMTGKPAIKRLLADRGLHEYSINVTAVLRTEHGTRAALVVNPRTVLTIALDSDGQALALEGVGAGSRGHMQDQLKHSHAKYETFVDESTGLMALAFDQDLFPGEAIKIAEDGLVKDEAVLLSGSPSGNLNGSSRMRMGALVSEVDDKHQAHLETLAPLGGNVSGSPVFNAKGEVVGLYIPGDGKGTHGSIRAISRDDVLRLSSNAQSRLHFPPKNSQP